MNEPPAAAGTAEYMQKAKTRVRMYTPSGIVEGDYSHVEGVRLSDSLRNAATGERYILLTDVTISPISGGDAIGEPVSFILLSTAHISVIIPLGEQ